MVMFCDNYGRYNDLCNGVKPICEHYKGQVSFERNIPEWLQIKIFTKIEHIKSSNRCACKDEVIKALESVLDMKYND
jgi:hypothetical protein